MLTLNFLSIAEEVVDFRMGWSQVWFMDDAYAKLHVDYTFEEEGIF